MPSASHEPDAAGNRHAPQAHHRGHPHLRAALARARRRRRPYGHKPAALPLGARLADAVAAVVGSWPFIAAQSALLAGWIAVNAALGPGAWDPYPFILLNLMLSFQAAYTAPVIMMSQNRQADLDRLRAVADYQINLRAEAEIALLHEKVDLLRETEVKELIGMLRHALERLEALERGAAGEARG